MSRDLGALFEHNLWANLQIIDVCAGLSEEQLTERLPSTYGSVAETLLHLVAAEGRYVNMLRGEPRDDTIGERKGFPGIAVLREHAMKSGQALIDIANSFEYGQVLRGVWRDEPYEIPAIIVLIQAINHATEHRTHIVGILHQNGVETPEIDGWAYEDVMKK